MAPPRSGSGYDSSAGMPMFRRPGPALRALLVLFVVLAFVNSAMAEYGSREAYGQMVKLMACTPDLVTHGWVWTLVTSAFITVPVHLINTLFLALGLYFLSVDLEASWGSRRYLGFILASVVAGNVLTVLLDLLPLSWGVLHPGFVTGPGAALAAVAVAWSLRNAEMVIRLFFILPMKGKYLFWITVGFSALGVVFPSQMMPLEGAFAPFAGIALGMAYSSRGVGAPSPLRAFYLRMKLALLRRKSGGAHLASYGLRPVAGSAKRISRSGGPALHVVYGGLDDDGKPKDKRTLN